MESGFKIGERLITRNRITEEQLKQALDRQRFKGGRLGQNLVAMGMVTEEEVKELFNPVPRQPESLEETGLSEVFINELILKHALDWVEFTVKDIAQALRLPSLLLNNCFTTLRRERLIEVKGAAEMSKFSYRYCLTDGGRSKASMLKEICRYTGPAPVPFNEYKNMVEMQTIKSISVDDKAIEDAFTDIVLSDYAVSIIGPAVSSGKAIFLYGPPGNGKTTVAERIGSLLPGAVYVPHAIVVHGEIITIFDESVHDPVKDDFLEGKVDLRWVRVRRPVVFVGGEMTMKGLDLDFNPLSRYYVAPLQLKANNGLFIIDDFGRQQIEPQVLLNRWIVPLERRTDFLSFQTGMKIEVPFDQLAIFSTNLDPKSLVDEAFLRRIRYKINVDYPDLEGFQKIFEKVCQANGIDYKQVVFDFRVEGRSRKFDIPFTACHCRDLIDNSIGKAYCQGVRPELSIPAIKASWNSYYVKL